MEYGITAFQGGYERVDAVEEVQPDHAQAFLRSRKLRQKRSLLEVASGGHNRVSFVEQLGHELGRETPVAPVTSAVGGMCLLQRRRSGSHAHSRLHTSTGRT